MHGHSDTDDHFLSSHTNSFLSISQHVYPFRINTIVEGYARQHVFQGITTELAREIQNFLPDLDEKQCRAITHQNRMLFLTLSTTPNTQDDWSKFWSRQTGDSLLGGLNLPLFCLCHCDRIQAQWDWIRQFIPFPDCLDVWFRCLLFAFERRDIRVIRSLTRLQIYPNLSSLGFDLAVEEKRTKILSFLLSHAIEMGLDVNMPNHLGDTKFMYACANGHTKIVKLFLELAGESLLDVNAQNDSGWTAFSYACFYRQRRIIDLLGQYSKAKRVHVDVNVKDRDGWTGFMCACGNGDVETVQCLLDWAETFQLDVKAKNGMDRSGAYLAVNNQDVDGGREIIDMIHKFEIEQLQKHSGTGFQSNSTRMSPSHLFAKSFL